MKRLFWRLHKNKNCAFLTTWFCYVLSLAKSATLKNLSYLLKLANKTFNYLQTLADIERNKYVRNMTYDGAV